MRTMDNIYLKGRHAHVYSPRITAAQSLPVIFANDGDKVLDDIGAWLLVNEPAFVFVAIEPLDRLDDYTPWPVQALPGMVHDFGGQADAYLGWIGDCLIPHLEANYPVRKDPAGRAMLGYSLGALVANYALLTRSEYGTVMSCSASYWYPEFLRFMDTHDLAVPFPEVYVSVGDREGVSAPGLIHSQVENTRIARAWFERKLPPDKLTCINHPGDHFDQVDERLKAALKWFMHNRTIY